MTASASSPQSVFWLFSGVLNTEGRSRNLTGCKYNIVNFHAQADWCITAKFNVESEAECGNTASYRACGSRTSTHEALTRHPSLFIGVATSREVPAQSRQATRPCLRARLSLWRDRLHFYAGSRFALQPVMWRQSFRHRPWSALWMLSCTCAPRLVLTMPGTDASKDTAPKSQKQGQGEPFGKKCIKWALPPTSSFWSFFTLSQAHLYQTSLNSTTGNTYRYAFTQLHPSSCSSRTPRRCTGLRYTHRRRFPRLRGE